MHPTSRQADRQHRKSTVTRARIERAAISLFAAQGVDAVSTRELAQAAGLSEGALYRHFDGKEAFATELFFKIHRCLADAVAEAAEIEGTLTQKTNAIVSAYCEFADADWDSFSFHLLNTHRFLPYSDKVPEAPQSAVDVVQGVIQDAIKRGELQQCDAGIKTAMVLGVVLQVAFHKIYGRLDAPLSAQKDTVATAIQSLLHA